MESKIVKLIKNYIKPKALVRFKGDDGKQYGITFLEKEFCEKYLELYGNGTAAYLEVYDKPELRIHISGKNKGKQRPPMTVKTASVQASKALGKVSICAYINTKLEEYGFCDTNAEKQHLFVLNQHKDLHAKNKAIENYYKLKRRGGFGDEKQLLPQQNFIQINQKIIKVIDNAEAEMAKALSESIDNPMGNDAV